MYRDFQRELGIGAISPAAGSGIDDHGREPHAARDDPAGEADLPQGAPLSAAFLSQPWIGVVAQERVGDRVSDRVPGSAGPPCAIARRPDDLDAEYRHRAAIALSALGNEQRVDIFRYLSARSPSLLSPVQIARELGLPVRVVSAELSRLRRARLVRETGTGRRRAYAADNRQARDCLELVHELARVLHAA